MNISYDLKHNVGDIVCIPKVLLYPLTVLDRMDSDESEKYIANLIRKIYNEGVRYSDLPYLIKAKVSKIYTMKGKYNDKFSELRTKYICKLDNIATEFAVSSADMLKCADLYKVKHLIDNIVNDEDFESIKEIRKAINSIAIEYSPIASINFDSEEIITVPNSALPDSLYFNRKSIGDIQATVDHVLLYHEKVNSTDITSSVYKSRFTNNGNSMSMNIKRVEGKSDEVISVGFGLEYEKYVDGVFMERVDISKNVIVSTENTRKEDAKYKLVVHPDDDVDMAKVGTPISWCILKWHKSWCNHRHGWSASIECAFKDMKAEYDKILIEDGGIKSDIR